MPSMHARYEDIDLIDAGHTIYFSAKESKKERNSPSSLDSGSIPMHSRPLPCAFLSDVHHDRRADPPA